MFLVEYSFMLHSHDLILTDDKTGVSQVYVNDDKIARFNVIEVVDSQIKCPRTFPHKVSHQPIERK